jgi:hypothetical protein
MPMPNDGLRGLAPVEPQKLAGIMPNAQHQTFHGFMSGLRDKRMRRDCSGQSQPDNERSGASRRTTRTLR